MQLSKRLVGRVHADSALSACTLTKDELFEHFVLLYMDLIEDHLCLPTFSVCTHILFHKICLKSLWARKIIQI